jgi:GT2 family glycosyltransferase
MSEVLDVSIIIVNWNTAQLLAKCLESIYKAGSQYSFEIIVIDNGSQDESVSMISHHFPLVTVIINAENLGFAFANNQGMSIGRGRYLMLLNSDTIVLPGTIDRLIQVADTNPQLGVLGPKLLNSDGTLQKSWASFPSILSELTGRNFRTRMSVPNNPFAYEVDWIGGACMLVRYRTVEEVGKMDDNFFFYSEELDWCYRIKKKKWKIWYLTNAEIYHLGGGSASRGSLEQLIRLYQSKLRYFGKYHSNLRVKILRYGLAVVNALGVVRRIVFFNWSNRKVAWQRINVQSKLVWYLFWNQYPETGHIRLDN